MTGKTNDEEIAFVNALKAVDYEKEYQQALRDIAETVLGMDFDDEDNNDVKPFKHSVR